MTAISSLLEKGRTYSFEFFPPKNDEEHSVLTKTLSELQPLNPSFVSVTYRGGASSRERTFQLVTAMLHTTTLVPMAHLTCVGHSRLDLAEILVEFRRAGIENLMALGGDPPSVGGAERGELYHAIELVELARSIGGFCIGVAAHPLGHPLSSSLAEDRRHLAKKLALADFAVTQFFFSADEYTKLVDDMGALNVTKYIIPGIMPVTTLSGVARMATMGAAVPEWLVQRLEAADKRGGAPAVREEGIAAATQLCEELLANGAPGLHFYTLNRSSATRDIYRALGLGTV